jgi:hypothetical protein
MLRGQLEYYGLMFRKYPAILFQLSAFSFAHDLTLYGFTAVILSCACNCIILRAIVQKEDLKQRRLALGFLQQFRKRGFTRVPLAQAVGIAFATKVAANAVRTDYGAVYTPSMKAMIRKLGLPLTDKAEALTAVKNYLTKWLRGKTLTEIAQNNIFVVVVGQGDAPPPTQLVAYPVWHGAYIFLLDPPQGLVGVARFYLYHELGHSSAIANHLNRRAINADYLFYLVLWFFVLQQPVGSAAGRILTGAFFFMLITLGVFHWSTIEWNGDALNEAWAGTFALANLTQSDQKEVILFFKRYPLSTEGNILTFLYKKRLELFRQNLEIVERGGDELAWPFPSNRTAGAELVLLSIIGNYPG